MLGGRHRRARATSGGRRPDRGRRHGRDALSPSPAAGPAGPLPEAVRLRVVAAASETLGELEAAEVPAALRRFVTFAPARRARLAATPLATALDNDDGFRRRVATRLRAADPDLAGALDRGELPPAVDPVEAAACAYVLRGPGWEDVVGTAAERLDQRAREDDVERLRADVARLHTEVATLRARRDADRAEAADEVREARAETAELRRLLREERGTARRAVQEAEALRAAATAAATERVDDAERRDAEVRRLRARVDDLEATLAAARQSVRDGRARADRDLRLLLDTLLGAARGLERELALPPVVDVPGDDVAATAAAAGARADVGGGLAPDDPLLLERLLVLPRAHLVVDAYNVTKTAYGDLPLADQRRRLVGGLAGLAARTSAEITAVFDGAAVSAPAASWPRGVRVLFSAPGETADALVLRVVAAEPEGRVVVVVSSDREVAEGAARRGARPVASSALARLLERG